MWLGQWKWVGNNNSEFWSKGWVHFDFSLSHVCLVLLLLCLNATQRLSLHASVISLDTPHCGSKSQNPSILYKCTSLQHLVTTAWTGQRQWDMISKPLNKQLDHYLPVNELVSNSDLNKVILPFKQQRTKILKKPVHRHQVVHHHTTLAIYMKLRP